jgi:murein L,D-transpeptidase YcbB/YkuD
LAIDLYIEEKLKIGETMKLNKVLSYVLSSSIVLSQLQVSAQTAGILQNTVGLQNVLSTRSILKAGSTLFETADLIKLYSERNFEPIWIRNGQKTEFVEAYKKMVDQISLKHGLIVSDYYSSELEAYLQGLSPENAMATEILMSNLYLRLASHLSDGRMEPTTIDNDVRFKKRTFVDHRILAQAVSSVPAMMSPIVETLAPEHIYYKNTLNILADLYAIKAQGGYKVVRNPKVTIKLNTKHAIVPSLRERVLQQGYNLSSVTDTTYDLELSNAIQDIQKENGFLVNQDLLADSGAWNVLTGATVESRILQTQATLEKLRWLPKKLEHNMIFVNTNATEMKVYENNQVIKTMNTINGRALRRTPMMQTWLTHVVLNTTWTATDSVILQDKLPEIQKDVNFLKRIRMRIISKETGAEVDPATLNWSTDSRGIAKRHTFVMDPGPKNALGVYKFPMSSDKNTYGSNSDDIFMHFTDDPSLFAKSSRHLSSGCVRLSEAKWFAEYLLRNNPQYTPAYIDSIISKGIEGEVFEPNIRIKLNPEEFRAVYTVPLTVERTASGKNRFMKDVYLHDRRILNSALSIPGRSDQSILGNSLSTTSTGSLTVIGQAGPMQYSNQVVVQKCQEPEVSINSKTGMRKLIKKCNAPLKFSLNTMQTLESGSYIVGFENTLYPGFVEISAGANIQIELQKIVISNQLAKEKNIKIYRDMGSLVEQKKIYFQQYYSGQSLFRETIRSYGDLSIAGLGEADVSASTPNSYCSENNLNSLVLAKDIREHALFVCETLNSAQNMMDLADLYRFQPNGTFQEAVVDYPGDIFPKRHLRKLVGAPMKQTDFVSVMPGHYRIVTESGKNSELINTMFISESYPAGQRVFAKSRLSLVNGNEVSEGDVAEKVHVADSATNAIGQLFGSPTLSTVSNRCGTATVWRTELRSYCTLDSLDGCARTTAKLCEEIKLDLRFRK